MNKQKKGEAKRIFDMGVITVSLTIILSALMYIFSDDGFYKHFAFGVITALAVVNTIFLYLQSDILEGFKRVASDALDLVKKSVKRIKELEQELENEKKNN